jgi:hypothetical protein
VVSNGKTRTYGKKNCVLVPFVETWTSCSVYKCCKSSESVFSQDIYILKRAEMADLFVGCLNE